MATVTCRVDDLERGDLPAISVKTGRPCANPVAVPLRAGRTFMSPGGRKVLAVVPLEAGRARAHTLMNRASWIVLVLFAASLAAAFAIGLLPAVVCFVAYAVLVVVGDARWFNARPGAQQDEIVLTNVHPDFVRAVDAQYSG